MSSLGVVICYPLQWHWVLSLENTLQQRQNRSIVTVFDFSTTDGRRALINQIPFTPFWKFRRKAVSLLRENNINYVRVRYSLISKLIALARAISSKYPAIIDSNTDKYSSIFPSLVDLIDDTQIDLRKFRKYVIYERYKSILIRSHLKNLIGGGFNRVTTVNGRFTKNYEVRLWGQSNETEVTFLEFGATKESYEEYLVSPHSFSELAQKMMGSWDGSENQKQVARNYFQELIGFDRYAGISWTKEMISGQLPRLPVGMRVCTFFTSTQKEFVGVGDAEDDSLFENQFVAFDALQKELSRAGDWFIVIRRHPKFLNVQHDADGKYWERYKAFKNVFIVEPDSQVDSYALGHRSDLVAHFNSSIAIQLVYGGHRSVLTLGNAMWSELLPGTVARSQSAISEFLTTITKDWTSEMTLPWAYFRATYGHEFEFFEFDSDNNSWKFINLF